MPNTIPALFLDLLKAAINLVEAFSNGLADVPALRMFFKNGGECCQLFFLLVLRLTREFLAHVQCLIKQMNVRKDSDVEGILFPVNLHFEYVSVQSLDTLRG